MTSLRSGVKVKEMIKLINKISYRIYQWRGQKDKLDDSFIWVLAGLFVCSILFEGDFINNLFRYAIFPSYFFYDNIFVALLLVPFVFYIYFTLSNFIIHKFDFLWLKTRGWKISVDTTLIFSFLIVIGYGIGFLSPELHFLGIDFFYIVLFFFIILYYLWVSYFHRLRPKLDQKIYFDDLKKMKDEGKITDEKYQKAIATNPMRDEKGTYIGIYIEDGHEYSGEFKKGKFNGQGTYTFSNGDKTIGEFRDNKPHGQGTFVSSKGEKYVGEFKEGKFNGQGTYTYTDGTGYVGEFRDNNKNGYGKETFPNGLKYIGEYKDDKPHGQGTMTNSDGKVEKGIWKDGKLVKEDK